MTSLSWAHLRVWHFYTLINLAYCWIWCKLKLHSSPNTISFTAEIIWKYFLKLLVKNNKIMPRYTHFQLYFFWQTWVIVLFLNFWCGKSWSWFLAMLTVMDVSWKYFLMTTKYNYNTRTLPNFNFFRVTSV